MIEISPKSLLQIILVIGSLGFFIVSYVGCRDLRAITPLEALDYIILSIGYSAGSLLLFLAFNMSFNWVGLA